MNNPSSPVKQLIGRFETQTNLNFKPSVVFYQSLGINRIRFSQLAAGKKKPDSDEIKGLTQYFSQFFPVKVEDLI